MASQLSNSCVTFEPNNCCCRLIPFDGSNVSAPPKLPTCKIVMPPKPKPGVYEGENYYQLVKLFVKFKLYFALS
jgi:hypothetical protein